MDKGFTLIELIIGITLLLAMSAMIVATTSHNIESTRTKSAASESIRQARELLVAALQWESRRGSTMPSTGSLSMLVLDYANMNAVPQRPAGTEDPNYPYSLGYNTPWGYSGGFFKLDNIPATVCNEINHQLGGISMPTNGPSGANQVECFHYALPLAPLKYGIAARLH
jgi:prepilin-type N-terminal cleavage/methylation domain-containing protein